MMKTLPSSAEREAEVASRVQAMKHDLDTDDVFEAVRGQVKDYINNLPMAISNDDFSKHCAEMGIDSDSFKRIKKKLIETGDLGHIMHRSSSIHYYGKPELIDNYLSRMGESYVRMP